MAMQNADRVKETSTTTGTGTYSLAGAVTGFRTFVAGVGTGNTCWYCATDGTDWEVGVGTVTDATPDTLARTTILASSNAGSAVNWGAGTRTIFCTLPATFVPSNKAPLILSAAGGKGTTTAGCGGPTQVEAAANKENYFVLEFDTTTEENAFWTGFLPDNYDGGTVTFRYVWANASGLTTETVVFGLKAIAYADGDTIDAAWGSEVTLSDTWIGQGKFQTSADSSAVTIGGSPAAGRPVIFNLARKVASDNLTGDARLKEAYIEYGISAVSV